MHINIRNKDPDPGFAKPDFTFNRILLNCIYTGYCQPPTSCAGAASAKWCVSRVIPIKGEDMFNICQVVLPFAGAEQAVHHSVFTVLAVKSKHHRCRMPGCYYLSKI